MGPPTCCSRESSCRESSRQHLFTGEAMGFVCVVAPCSDHVAKRHGTGAVQLDQCVYGADTVKTNGDCFQCTMDAERSKALRSSTASLPHWKGLRTACGGHGVAHYLSSRISCWALLGMGVRLEGSACIADRRVPDIRRPRRSSKPATYNIVLVRLDLYGGGTTKHNVMKENIAETSAQKRERENLAAQSLDHRPSGELGQKSAPSGMSFCVRRSLTNSSANQGTAHFLMRWSGMLVGGWLMPLVQKQPLRAIRLRSSEQF